MSLTWKLCCGFLFALVLQVLQMGTGAHFTALLQTAAGQVATSLTGILAVQNGLDATAALQARLAVDRRPGKGAPDPRVYQVYVDELRAQIAAIDQALPAAEVTKTVASRIAHVQEELQGVVAAATPDDTAEALVFLDDALGDAAEALHQVRVQVGAIARQGMADEAAIKDLPLQASVYITLTGVVVLALFVGWFSRQLVLPIEAAWAALEGRVAERTTELERANVDLRLAKDAAEDAIAAKSRLLANVSHELRTPLTAILGFTEELAHGLGTAATPALGDALATVQRNAHHLVRLVGDLLDVSKLEAGKMTLEHLPVPLVALVHEVAAAARHKAQAKGLDVRVTADPAVPAAILGDPVRLRQIVTNLVDNAVKFTARGGVEITVRCTDAPVPTVAVDVCDSGIGMDAATLARLFRPFEQADLSTTRQYGGTGLGLALSRQLAQGMGGDLTATSEPGRGSCFHFTLPVTAVAPLATQPASAAPTPPPAGPVLAGRRVLVVEDGADNQRLIGSILRRAGCEVELAGDGAQGVAHWIAGKGSLDAILMDLQMPVMDGLQATRALREQGCRTPIFALTANAQPEDRAACLAAGCDGFLTKPIDRKVLLAALADTLQATPAGPSRRA